MCIYIYIYPSSRRALGQGCPTAGYQAAVTRREPPQNQLLFSPSLSEFEQTYLKYCYLIPHMKDSCLILFFQTLGL